VLAGVLEDDLSNSTESDRLEEHLLICQSCRNRLKATDEYVVAMKAAAKL
jgi:predicted anti-sigma-YlaC factor YlaD